MEVRKVNRNRIYRLIHSHAGISRPEIAKRLRMSLPTVFLNMKSLLEKGLVRETGSLESTGGRKAASLSIVADARQAVGIDITRDRVTLVLVDLAGNTRRKSELNLAFSAGRAFVDRIGRAVDKLLRDENVPPGSLAGAGISVPGILSGDRSDVVTSYVIKTGEDGYSLAALDRRLGIPCAHVNDANAAGTAELWSVDPDRHFIYLALSNSVGGALVWDGNPRPGDNLRAGEIGHMTLVPGGLECYCGKRGCLDAYCNASILSRAANGDLGAFFGLLDRGDAKAAKIWARYADCLATAVNSLRMIFDYDIVIGGYVGARIGGRLDEIRERAARLNTFHDSAGYVQPCRHTAEASAVGAALFQIENFIDSI